MIAESLVGWQHAHHRVRTTYEDDLAVVATVVESLGDLHDPRCINALFAELRRVPSSNRTRTYLNIVIRTLARLPEGDVQQLGRRLGVIESFGEHPERERLDADNGLISRCAVAEYAGKIWDLGNPATAVFELEFDSETEAHGRTATRPAGRCSTTAFNLDDAINTPGLNFCPFDLRDGTYIFYTMNRDYWVSVKILEDVRVKALGTSSSEPKK